jgi:hypothetical protein
MTLLGVAIHVATAEDTVLAKLEWAKLGESERQLADVRGKTAAPDHSAIGKFVATSVMVVMAPPCHSMVSRTKPTPEQYTRSVLSAP